MVRGRLEWFERSSWLACDALAACGGSMRRPDVWGRSSMRRPMKGHEHEAEHVDRRQQRRQQADRPEQRVPALIGVEQDFVLAEKTGKRRQAGNRDRADDERPVGDRQVLPQAAHSPHVLLARERVNHRARSEKEERLEERMRVEVEDARRVRANAHRQKHVAELRHGRIRQDALDVVLHQPNRPGQKRRRRPDDRDDVQRQRRMAEQHGVAANHVHPSRHHRRRMNERGDGRGAFHRVGQPGIERDLGRLARGADEQQERDDRHGAERRLGAQSRRRFAPPPGSRATRSARRSAARRG